MIFLIRRALALLVPVSFVITVYLYLYPIFHGCAFPSTGNQSSVRSFTDILRQHLSGDGAHATSIAPFKLLAIGDPQLEGDTSLPNRETATLPSFFEALNHLRELEFSNAAGSLKNLAQHELPVAFKYYRKELDLLGNDYYLAHIYRTVHWWTKPTHVSVLGDLVGSQWIDDGEFEARGQRFWNRVFRNGLKVDPIAEQEAPEILAARSPWNNRIINVVGNHDVGYAGDITRERMARFESIFGLSNYEVSFQLPRNETSLHDGAPLLRIVNLDSLILDTPALDEELQTQTYDFINAVVTSSKPVEDRTIGTILLTHLPLYKRSGVCSDGPFFSFHDDSKGGGVREQNHLSDQASAGLLQSLFGMGDPSSTIFGGMGRKGIILAGHDHPGCDVRHFFSTPVCIDDEGKENSDEACLRGWRAIPESTISSDATPMVSNSTPNIREITVRSMMGDFGGNIGLLSAWFDEGVSEWQFEYATCQLGVQHIWWAVHITDLVTLIGLLIVGAGWMIQSTVSPVSDLPSSAGSKTSRETQLDASNLDVAPGTGKEIGFVEASEAQPHTGGFQSPRKKRIS